MGPPLPLPLRFAQREGERISKGALSPDGGFALSGATYLSALRAFGMRRSPDRRYSGGEMHIAVGEGADAPHAGRVCSPGANAVERKALLA